MSIQTVDYLAIAPPLLVTLAALGVLVADAFLPARRHGLVGQGALGGVVLALAATVALAADAVQRDSPRGTFCIPPGLRGGGPASCSYVVDEFTLLFQLVLLVAGAVVILLALPEIGRTALPAGEFHFLLLASLAGALTLAAGRDLVILVVALELVSLPAFALVALRRYDGRSSEAGLKMFLVSVVAAAVMLFGISLVYGATGSVHLDRLASALDQPQAAHPVVAVGVVLVLVGFGFKIAAVPFHFWAPDTYQGAPVAVAAFLAVVSKAAGFAGLVLVLSIGFGSYSQVWGPLVAVLAAVSMTAGNVVALRQRSAVRLLAWSSIAHAGYMLAPLGAVAGLSGLGAGPARREATEELVAATVGYVAIYMVMTLGAFAVVAMVGWVGTRGGGDLDDYRGLVRSHPVIAVTLAFFLACLAGLPPGLAGLFAKIVVIQAAVTGGYAWLAVVMAVNTAIGLYYYLLWATRLFGTRPQGATVPAGRVQLPVAVAIGVAAVATIALSLAPELVFTVSPVGVLTGSP